MTDNSLINVKEEDKQQNIIKYTCFNTGASVNTKNKEKYEAYATNLTKVDGFTNIDSSLYYNYISYILTFITNNQKLLCRDLDLEHIKDNMLSSHIVIILSLKNDDPTKFKILGFALVKIMDPTQILINLICSHSDTKYAGETLLNCITYICKNVLNIDSIMLDTVISAKSFYTKYGFRDTGSKIFGDTFRMRKSISGGKGGTKRKTRRNRRKSVRRHRRR